MQTDKIPWHDMMRYAFFTLGILPKDFWELTMVEFLELIKHQDICASAGASMTKKQLQELIEKFG